MATGVFQNAIDEAWRHRLNQDLDAVRRDLVELKSKVGLPPGDLREDSLSGHSDNPLPALQVGLLWVSNARAEGRFEPAERGLELLEDFSHRHFDTPPFCLLFQKGLSLLNRGETSAALELFLAARGTARPGWETIAASTNGLLCMENLGLPLERSLEKLRKALVGFGEASGWSGILAQIGAFEIRHQFRRGDFSFCKNVVPGVDQSQYFRLWVSELPYHHYFSQRSASEIADLSDHRWLYKKAYRLRTIQGLSHPDDADEGKLSEVADRFYLWTWRWLTSKGEFPLARVLGCLEALNLPHQIHRLTAEDVVLVRNALHWIGLWDRSPRPDVRRLLIALRPSPGLDCPLFELELSLIHWLEARRDGRQDLAKDLYQTVVTHPLWGQRDLFFARLATDAQDHPLVGLNAELDRLFEPGDPLPPGGIRIHVHGKWIETSQGPVRSESLVNAFCALRGHPSLSCEELLERCFGLPRWNPDVHRNKIQNLLNRLRKIAPPSLTVQVRHDRVYWDGDWSGVEWEQNRGLEGALSANSGWRRLGKDASPPCYPGTNASPGIRPSHAFARIAHRTHVNRAELEKLAGISKSTATRLIARWVQEGKLQKTGSSRQTMYKVNGQSLSRGEGAP